MRAPVVPPTHVRAAVCAAVRRVTSPRLLLSSSHRRLGSIRADTGDAERAPSRERVVAPTERRRPRRACAGRTADARARRRVRRRASSDITAPPALLVASPARLYQSRHRRRRASAEPDSAISECEAAKITDTFRAHQQLLPGCKSATLRINPQQYDGAGPISGHSPEARVALVAARVKELIAPGGMANLTEAAPYVEYYFYHSACYRHIAYARGAAALSLSVFGVFPAGAYDGHFDGRGDGAS